LHYILSRLLHSFPTRRSSDLDQLKGLDVPVRIFALLKSMLAPDPKDRPQSARELLSAVHRCSTKFSTEARSRRRRSTLAAVGTTDRKSTRLNSSHVKISYAVF